MLRQSLEMITGEIVMGWFIINRNGTWNGSVELIEGREMMEMMSPSHLSQDPPGRGPVQPALGDPALAGSWTRWPTEVPSNPYHSVILWERVQGTMTNHQAKIYGSNLRRNACATLWCAYCEELVFVLLFGFVFYFLHQGFSNLVFTHKMIWLHISFNSIL